jgi:hypothetical protein
MMVRLPVGWVWVSVCALGLLPLVGCGARVKTVSVSGKVSLNGQPLTTGRVIYAADASKGNTTDVGCVGRLDSQGRYTLSWAGRKTSEQGKGAPVGWYKVTLGNMTGKSALDDLVDPKYFDESTTPLSIEVVADPRPEQYDINLTN